jgi:hypothetical protein
MSKGRLREGGGGKRESGREKSRGHRGGERDRPRVRAKEREGGREERERGREREIPLTLSSLLSPSLLLKLHFFSTLLTVRQNPRLAYLKTELPPS